jgi:hypothetical protein
MQQVAATSPPGSGSVSPPPRRDVIISCSTLIRWWAKIPRARLQASLFLFGSKRRWVFPATAEDRLDAARQPGRYHLMDRALLDLIAQKEQRGEVHFLKRDDLPYEQYPGDPDPGAYGRVSDWLVSLGYPPLQLDASWWKDASRSVERASWRHCRDGAKVVRNFEGGYHEYDELLELLTQSYGDGLLRGTMGDDLLSAPSSPTGASCQELEPEASAAEPHSSNSNSPTTTTTVAAAAAAAAAADDGSPPALWPLDKLLRRAAALAPSVSEASAAAPPSTAVLVMTGALCPVHSGHVLSLEYAREACEAAGIRVLGGFLSPSHDTYVRPKMQRAKQHFWGARARVEACEAAVAASDWLEVGRWEALGPHTRWPDFPLVCRALADTVCEQRAAITRALPLAGAPLPTVYYVCGFDHFLKCGLRGGMGAGLGLAVLPR